MTRAMPAPHEFDHHTVTLNGQRIHYVTAGEGEAVVLLHGWGQTWFEWRHVILLLHDRYRVVAPDLRGLGDSGKPATGYDKKSVAQDIPRLMDHLGIDRAHVVGHDFGMAVAFAMAHQFPDRILSLALMELMLFGLGGEKAMEFSREGGRWHHVFHAKCDLAAMLIEGKERDYLSWFYRSFAYDPTAISEDAVDEFVRAYSAPGAMDASLNYYRSCWDDQDDNRAWAETKLAMPILALGGASNMGEAVLKAVGPLGEDVSGGAVPNAGHWIPEEAPEALVERLEAHFEHARGAGER